MNSLEDEQPIAVVEEDEDAVTTEWSTGGDTCEEEDNG